MKNPPSDEHPRLRRLIRDVPDFPRPGILFRDITPLLSDAAGLREAVDALAAAGEGAGISAVAGIEARGFILGGAVAARLGAGFVPIRKPGKLPFRSRRVAYALEYGTDALEIHEDAVRPGGRILLVDDVLATGGTLAAACELVRGGGAEIAACVVLIELAALGGRSRVCSAPVHAVLRYP